MGTKAPKWPPERKNMTETTIYVDPNEPGLAWSQTHKNHYGPGEDDITSGPYGSLADNDGDAKLALKAERYRLLYAGVEVSEITNDSFIAQKDLSE
jgi:hypothetical protein